MAEEINESIVDAVRQRRHARTPGRLAALRDPDAHSVAVSGSHDHGCKHGFLVRESQEFGYMLLKKMIEQTLEPFRHLDAVKRALELGELPLLNTPEGKHAREALGANLLYHPNRQASVMGVRFVIEGVPFLYALASGAKTSASFDDNVWVEAVVQFVRDFRPAKLVVGPTSRLARRKHLFSQLSQHLATHRTLVVSHEFREGIDLTRPEGRMFWDMAATYAENDYLATINRLLTGVVFELKNGRYPRSATSLPPGYLKVPDGSGKSKVVPDESEASRKLVRRLIELAASEATPSEMASELAKLGLTARNPQVATEGRPPRADQVKYPETLIRNLLEHLPLYLEGKHVFRHEVALPHLDDFHGLPVHRQSPADNGFISVDLDFGLPPGGWHDKKLILDAIEKRLAPQDHRTRAAKTTVKPLAGMEMAADATYEYKLECHEQDSYRLRRRPRGSSGKFTKGVGEIVGSYVALDVHQALAAMIRDVAQHAPTSIRCPADTRDLEEALKQLQRRACEVRQKASNAREIAVTVEADERRKYIALAGEAEAEAENVDREARELASQTRTLPGALMNSDELAALAVILDQAKGALPFDIVRKVRSLFTNVRFVAPSAGTPHTKFQASLNLRMDDRLLAVGPFEKRIRNRASGSQSKKDSYRRRNIELMKDLWLEREGEDERAAIWEAEGFTPRSFRRRMLAILKCYFSPIAASALYDCPIVEVRRHLTEPHLHHGLPAGHDAEFLDEVRRIYRAPDFSWSKGWCPGGMTLARSVLAYVDKNASDPNVGVPLSEVVSRMGTSEPEIYKLAHSGPTRYGRKTAAPSFAEHHAYLEIDKVAPGEKTTVRVRACRHCGERKLLQPLRVPEVPGDLLCTKCRKSQPADFVFPNSYFEPWDGPQSAPLRGKDFLIDEAPRRKPGTGNRPDVGTQKLPFRTPSKNVPTKGRAPKKSHPPVDHREVREWACAQGIVVGERGRVSNRVVDQFLKSQGN